MASLPLLQYVPLDTQNIILLASSHPSFTLLLDEGFNHSGFTTWISCFSFTTYCRLLLCCCHTSCFRFRNTFWVLAAFSFPSTTLCVASALLRTGDVYPLFFKPFLEAHFLTPMRYLPPLRLYSFTRKAFAYAEGYTLNFLFTWLFTAEYRRLFVGTGFFFATFLFFRAAI